MIDRNRNTSLDSGILQSLSLEVVECILRPVTRMEKLPNGLSHSLLKELAKSHLEKRHFSRYLKQGPLLSLDL